MADDQDPGGWFSEAPPTYGPVPRSSGAGGWSFWFVLVVVALIAWGALSTPTADGKPYREPPACGRNWPPTCDQERAGR